MEYHCHLFRGYIANLKQSYSDRTRATLEVRRFLFEDPYFDSLRTLPKTDLDRYQSAVG